MARLSRPASLLPFSHQQFQPEATSGEEQSVLRAKRSLPSWSRMVNAQRCGLERLDPSSPEALARRDGGECNRAGGIPSTPGAPPGATQEGTR